MTTHIPLRESNIAQHPGHVEYTVQNHEDVMGIMVVAGRYVDPASATQRAQYARRQNEARKRRRGKRFAIKQVTKADECKTGT